MGASSSVALGRGVRGLRPARGAEAVSPASARAVCGAWAPRPTRMSAATCWGVRPSVGTVRVATSAYRGARRAWRASMRARTASPLPGPPRSARAAPRSARSASSVVSESASGATSGRPVPSPTCAAAVSGDAARCTTVRPRSRARFSSRRMAPPPSATTPWAGAGESRTARSARVSRTRKASSPSLAKISGTVMRARRRISASVSVTCSPRAVASSRATVVLPAPGRPTRTRGRCSGSSATWGTGRRLIDLLPAIGYVRRYGQGSPRGCVWPRSRCPRRSWSAARPPGRAPPWPPR